MTTAGEPVPGGQRPPARPHAPPPGGMQRRSRVSLAWNAMRRPLVAIEVVWATGSVAHWQQIAWLPFVVAGAVAAIAGWFIVSRRTGRRLLALYVAAVSLAAGALVATGVVHGWLSMATILPILICGVWLGPIYGVGRYRRLRQAEEELEREQAEAEAEARRAAIQRAADERRKLERAVCAAVRGEDIRIKSELSDLVWRQGQRKFVAGFAVVLVLGKGAPVRTEMVRKTEKIEKFLAMGLGKKIRPGSVVILPRESADEVEMIVATEDILVQKFPVVMDRGPLTSNGPLEWATGFDGRRVAWNPVEDPHVLIVGQNKMGKTTILRRILLALARCPNNVTWMVTGGDKAQSTFASWMRPTLLGKRSSKTPTGYVEPLLDRIGATIQEAGDMLCDLYRAMKQRETVGADGKTDEWTPRATGQRITFVIEEGAPALLDTRHRFRPFDWIGPEADKSGKPEGLTFSELLVRMLRPLRAAGISVIILTHGATKAHLGEKATEIKSQIPYRISTRQVGGPSDRSQTFATDFSHVDLGELRRGEVYVECAGLARPIKAKADLVETDDVQLGAELYTQYVRPLDNFTASAIPGYSERWTNEAVQTLLRRVIDVPVQRIPWTTTVDSPAAARSATAVLEREDADALGGDPVSDVDARAAELAMLNELWRLEQGRAGGPTGGGAEPPAVPTGGGGGDEPPVLPTGGDGVPAEPRRVFKPGLLEDAEVLLRLLAESGLLDGEWVASEEAILPLVLPLGWEKGSAGCRRIKRVLETVGVPKPGRPRRGTGGRKWPSGYRAKDIKAALDRVSWFED